GASELARTNERENSRTCKRIKEIRRSERTDHIEHRQPAVCAKRLLFSRGIPFIDKTKFSRRIRAARFRCWSRGGHAADQQMGGRPDARSNSRFDSRRRAG